MKCKCFGYKIVKGNDERIEWEQEFDILPRHGDTVIKEDCISHVVDYCIFSEGVPPEIIMKKE